MSTGKEPIYAPFFGVMGATAAVAFSGKITPKYRFGLVNSAIDFSFNILPSLILTCFQPHIREGFFSYSCSMIVSVFGMWDSSLSTSSNGSLYNWRRVLIPF